MPEKSGITRFERGKQEIKKELAHLAFEEWVWNEGIQKARELHAAGTLTADDLKEQEAMHAEQLAAIKVKRADLNKSLRRKQKP